MYKCDELVMKHDIDGAAKGLEPARMYTTAELEAEYRKQAAKPAIGLADYERFEREQLVAKAVEHVRATFEAAVAAMNASGWYGKVAIIDAAQAAGEMQQNGTRILWVGEGLAIVCDPFGEIGDRANARARQVAYDENYGIAKADATKRLFS